MFSLLQQLGKEWVEDESETESLVVQRRRGTENHGLNGGEEAASSSTRAEHGDGDRP